MKFVKGILVAFIFIYSLQLISCKDSDVKIANKPTYSLSSHLSDTIYQENDLILAQRFMDSYLQAKASELVVFIRLQGVCSSCMSINNDSLFSILKEIDTEKELLIITDKGISVHNHFPNKAKNRIMQLPEDELIKYGLYSIYPIIIEINEGIIENTWSLKR